MMVVITIYVIVNAVIVINMRVVVKIVGKRHAKYALVRRNVNVVFAAGSVGWNFAVQEIAIASIARRMPSIYSCRTRLCRMLHRIVMKW